MKKGLQSMLGIGIMTKCRAAFFAERPCMQRGTLARASEQPLHWRAAQVVLLMAHEVVRFRLTARYFERAKVPKAPGDPTLFWLAPQTPMAEGKKKHVKQKIKNAASILAASTCFLQLSCFA